MKINIVMGESGMIEATCLNILDSDGFVEGKDILFKQENDLYVISEYAKYIILSQGRKTFAKLICDLDKTEYYHRESMDYATDPAALREEFKKYKTKREDFDKLLSEWKENNAEKFQKEPFIPFVQVYACNFVFKSEVTLGEAVQGYKYCGEMIDLLDMSKVRISSKTVIKPEFKEEYSDICKTFRDKVGLPKDSEIKASVPQLMERKTRICLNRDKHQSVGGTFIFAEDFIKYFIKEKFDTEEQNEGEY